METIKVNTTTEIFAASHDDMAKHWIGGRWVDSAKHGTSINPCTGELIGTYADGGLKEAREAVKEASTAFHESAWKSDHALRSKVLYAMADSIESNSAVLVQMLCTEVGKIAGEAAMEVGTAPSILRHWAGKTFIAGRAGEASPGVHSVVIREAIGVAGIIAPFNAPVALTIRALAPALAAGTTVVVKLPGVTAQTNWLLSKIISQTPHLPPGVINLITESGSEASAFLVQSPDVPVISFTGSSNTGRAIAAAGASCLKRLVLELGGKTPMIVFDDANIDIAIPTIVKAVTLFAGQFCMTGSRILVQKNIADTMRKRLTEIFSTIKAGPGIEPDSDMGAMINHANVQRVNKMVEEAITAGATTLVRGGPVAEGKLSKGAYYLPTLLELTDSTLPIVQEEVFGPVATLQVFDTEAEAISLANDSHYGLAASIWSQDISRPWRVAKALQAGTVWLNTYAQIFPQFEEGGYRQSGVGRLHGEAGLENFLEYKHIVLNMHT
ncbi:aldehyde dehydrogenase family protein [Chitinophagaceae bacterium 26-R-25]|nr:aldehyde dehydrogenase family protein [Chitinophagaceae bacterium 26-R-25]